MGKTFRHRDDYEDDDYDMKTKKMQDRRGERRKKINERNSYGNNEESENDE